MKCYISVVCVLSAFVAVTLAAPYTNEISPIHHQVKRQTSNTQQETLNRVITFSNQKIQMLRKLCPQLFQVLDNVIQNVTSQVFRVVGGALLRSGGLGGGGGGGDGASGGNMVSVVLPTFPPGEDDDDDENVDVRTGGSNSATETTATMTPVALSVDNGINEVTDNSVVSSTTTTSAPPVEDSPPFTSPSVASNIAKRHVRIARAANDLQTAASGENGPDPAEDLANIEGDDADRNKRNLGFGGQSAGGSGNFLFDLIRLVAGSGATEESDEKEAGVGGVAEVDVQGKTGEGIPGPITRLLVIANRGIANLIQDLILRLAQTSERIVNFKARLVTALI